MSWMHSICISDPCSEFNPGDQVEVNHLFKDPEQCEVLRMGDNLGDYKMVWVKNVKTGEEFEINAGMCRLLVSMTKKQ